jgi:hypothetical protein
MLLTVYALNFWYCVLDNCKMIDNAFKQSEYLRLYYIFKYICILMEYVSVCFVISSKYAIKASADYNTYLQLP